jgi:hypothetical protein
VYAHAAHHGKKKQRTKYVVHMKQKQVERWKQFATADEEEYAREFNERQGSGNQDDDGVRSEAQFAVPLRSKCRALKECGYVSEEKNTEYGVSERW